MCVIVAISQQSDAAVLTHYVADIKVRQRACDSQILIIKRENAAIIRDSHESPQIARLYVNSWLQLFADQCTAELILVGLALCRLTAHSSRSSTAKQIALNKSCNCHSMGWTSAAPRISCVTVAALCFNRVLRASVSLSLHQMRSSVIVSNWQGVMANMQILSVQLFQVQSK